jgi:thymidylate synthase
MTKADKYMYDMINRIQCEGYYDINPRPKYADGTPAHTLSVNHTFRTYDLVKGEFPICTLRPQAWKTGIREIFTIYQKPTNDIATMHDMGVTWWDEWDIGDGTIGQRYGATVSRYDLINNLIKDIQNDPYGRRKIVSLWQEQDLHETPGLAPCAFLTIWNVRNTNRENLGRGEGYLDMMLVQRSGDMLTASGPGGINEIQYASLLMMIARHCGYTPGVFSHVVANEQIYDRHIDAAEEMKTRYNQRHFIEETAWDEGYQRNDNEWMFQQPKLILNPEVKDFYQMTIDDFELVDYHPMKPQLKLELGI